MASSGVHSSASSSAMLERHPDVGGGHRLVGDRGGQPALEVGLLHVLGPAPERADQLVGAERTPARRRTLLRLFDGILDQRREGDQRPGAHRVGHRRGHAHLAEEAVQRLVHRELGPEPADELGGLDLIRIGERLPGAGEQHLEAQTGRRRKAAGRDQAGRGHDSSQSSNGGAARCSRLSRAAPTRGASFVPGSEALRPAREVTRRDGAYPG